MDTLLDFEDCVKDSPAFRLKLELFEADVSVLETQLDKVMKLCGKMVEAGQTYSAANQLFLTGLAELSMYHKKDSVITNCLNQFNQGLQEMVSFHTMLFDQTQRAISHQLTNLCTQFLPQLVETRREFVRIGEDLETAAVKNAQVSRHKAGDAERASHLLLATRKCYQHFALDYCLQLNTFQTQQRVDILNSIFSFVHAQFTFFHQGFDLLRDLEPTMKTMAAQVLTSDLSGPFTPSICIVTVKRTTDDSLRGTAVMSQCGCMSPAFDLLVSLQTQQTRKHRSSCCLQLGALVVGRLWCFRGLLSVDGVWCPASTSTAGICSWDSIYCRKTLTV